MPHLPEMNPQHVVAVELLRASFLPARVRAKVADLVRDWRRIHDPFHFFVNRAFQWLWQSLPDAKFFAILSQ